MMNLEWDPKESALRALQDEYNKLGEDALFYSHYELQKKTGIPADQWKKFLTHPKVDDWLRTEHTLLRQAQLQKITRDVSENSRSVGLSQTLNALSKLQEGGTTKDGPAFIYCYTPLNPAEEQAPNVLKVSEDPFRIKS